VAAVPATASRLPEPAAGETFDQTPVSAPLAPAPEPAFELGQTVTW